MNGLIINIDWAFFLGIVGTLILIAWYGGFKFARIETLLEGHTRILDDVEDRLSSLEGKRLESFLESSPLSLTEKGMRQLTESGLKDYIDLNIDTLSEKCRKNANSETAYDIQEASFSIMKNTEFESELWRKVKNAAYNNAMDVGLIKHIAGIYLRDKCLKSLGIEPGATVDPESTA
jgi:hypothetical protein